MYDGYPYSLSGKLTQKFSGRKKKVSNHIYPQKEKGRGNIINELMSVV